MQVCKSWRLIGREGTRRLQIDCRKHGQGVEKVLFKALSIFPYVEYLLFKHGYATSQTSPAATFESVTLSLDLSLTHVKHLQFEFRASQRELQPLLLPSSLKGWNQLEGLTIKHGGFVLNFGQVSEKVKRWTSLRSLKLCHCEALPSGSRFWRSLQLLKLEKLTAEELPADAVGEWIELQELMLGSCPMLQDLPEGVSSWKQIRRVEIQRAPFLGPLPTGVRAWGNLQKLLLWSCPEVTELPAAVGSWHRLKEISLFEVKLRELPAAVGEWSSLLVAEINFCGTLVGLPLEVAGWRKLSRFTLSSCHKIRSLPEGVAEWTRLQHLNLHSCPALESLPEGVSSWSQLREASVTICNKLTTLPRGTQRWFPLEILNLSQCSSMRTLLQAEEPARGETTSSSVPLPHTLGFQSWEYLTRLTLCELDIDCLPDSVERCFRLQGVRIYRCSELRDLPAGVKGWKNLERLNILSCEKLKSLPSEVGQWKQLQKISYKMNQTNLVLPSEVGAWGASQECVLWQFDSFATKC